MDPPVGHLLSPLLFQCSDDASFLLVGITKEISNPRAFLIFFAGEDLDPPCRVSKRASLTALLHWTHCFEERLFAWVHLVARPSEVVSWWQWRKI